MPQKMTDDFPYQVFFPLNLQFDILPQSCTSLELVGSNFASIVPVLQRS